MEKKVSCSKCQKKMLKVMRCSRCKSAIYCSRECQVKSWKTHKKNCVSVSKKKKKKVQQKPKKNIKQPDESNKLLAEKFGIKPVCINTIRNVPQEKIDIFMKWLIENGLKVHKKFKICGVKGKGLGMIALEPIKKEESVFSMPHNSKAFLSLTNFDQIDDKIFRKFAIEGHRSAMKKNEYNDFGPICVLIYERFINKNSFYKPYFDVLPKYEDLKAFPAYWSSEKLESIKGTLLYSHICKTEKLKIDFNVWKFEKFEKQNEGKYPKFTREMIVWAQGIFGTRVWEALKTSRVYDQQVVTYEKEVKKDNVFFLKPPFDFINTSPEVKSKLIFTVQKGDVMCQISPMDLTSGSEICQTQTMGSFLESFSMSGYVSIENMQNWMIPYFFTKLKYVDRKCYVGKNLKVFLPTEAIQYFQDGSQAFFIDTSEELQEGEEIPNIYIIDVKRMKKSVYDHIVELETIHADGRLLISEIKPKQERYKFYSELAVVALLVKDFYEKSLTKNPFYVSKKESKLTFSKGMLEYFELEKKIIIATHTRNLQNLKFLVKEKHCMFEKKI